MVNVYRPTCVCAMVDKNPPRADLDQNKYKVPMENLAAPFV